MNASTSSNPSPPPAELRPVEGFPGHFQARDGMVWHEHRGKWWALKPSATRNQSLFVTLRQEKDGRHVRLHLDTLFQKTYPEVPLPSAFLGALPRSLKARDDFRELPGWEDYRVGRDHTVWVKLKAEQVPSRGPRVELRHNRKSYVRSVAVLVRAAYAEPSQRDFWKRRIAPEGVPAPVAEPPAPVVAPSPPASVPPAWLAKRLQRARSVNPAGPALAPTPELIQPATIPDPAPEPPSEAGDADERESEGYAVGAQHGRARLTEGRVRRARRLHREGWTYAQLARRYGVSENTIMYAVKGRTWGHIPMEAIP